MTNHSVGTPRRRFRHATKEVFHTGQRSSRRRVRSPHLAAFLAGALLAGTAVAAGPHATDRPTDDGERRTPAWLTAKVAAALGTRDPVSWVPTGSFASSAEVRVPRYPFRVDGRDTTRLALTAVRGEQVSAQLAIAAGHRIDDLRARVSRLRGPDGHTLPPQASQVRYVRYAPVMRAKSEHDWSASIEDVSSSREVSGDRNPDVVGDPLAELPAVDVPAYAAQPVWFTFRVPRDARPGTYTATVTLRSSTGRLASYPLTLEVSRAQVPAPRDYRFHLDVWMQPETIATQADVPLWSRRHWRLMEAYFADLASRGQKVVNTAIVDNPWHHEWALGETRSQTWEPYRSMVAWAWDGERFSFDYDRFDRYVTAARRAGLGPTIAAYSMLAFHSEEHLTYTDTRTGKRVYEEVELGGERWREAWGAFLRDFSAHLRQRGWLADTWLSFDERPPETMTVVRDFVHEVAPEFDERIAVAGTLDTEGIAHNLSVGWRDLEKVTDELVKRRRQAGKRTTFYVYGWPPHPNTLAFSPAVEARMLPWIAAQRHLDGLLRWSYNSWPAEVFTDPVFVFVQGDEYLVYPGEKGRPMSSVRWEQLREGIEDFELVAQVRERLETGEADPERLRRALRLATRHHDGREKDPADLVEARRLVVAELLRED